MRLLLVTLVSLPLSLAAATILQQDQATQSSNSTGLKNPVFVTVCPTDGRRAVRSDPNNTTLAQIVTTNCVSVAADSVAVSSEGTLDLSGADLDMVLSYPDATTLNFASNRLDYFPSDPSVVAARSLILHGNNFRSLTDIDMPPELEYLDVSHCQITTIGSTLLYPQSLVKLRLGANKLPSLRGMNFPPNLRALELDDQPLVSLEGAALPPSLEILTAVNVSLTKLNASTQLPESLVSIDLSANRLAQLPDFYSFPSVTEVNVSFNAIQSIVGVQFPWTLTRLDLRGNPLEELEITRSDLQLFQSWSYLLPKLNQTSCRHAQARKVRLTDVELCVLEDTEFDRIYGKTAAVSGAGQVESSSSTLGPISIQPVIPATKFVGSERNLFTWAFLIIAIVLVAIVVIGVISTISWRHQQLRRKVQTMMARGSPMRTSSFNDDLLRAVGLDGELVATRFDSAEIKILHVLEKKGHNLIYLAAMRNGEAGEAGDLDMASTPKLLLDQQERRSAISALSLQDLESGGTPASGRQLVTLKRIVPEQCTPKSPVLRAFVEEIQLMAQLDHPKILSLLGVCWNTLSDVTMVQEYLPNGDLRALLKTENDRVKFGRSKRLRWKEAQSSFASTMSIRTAMLPSKSSIALDVAEALCYLHSFDPPVLHRELRSKHVFFNEHFDAKLSAIGAPSELQLDLAKTAALDSIAWIAPEVLRGERYTDKADIYALGILLTELATDARPFHGLASAAIVLKVTRENERPSLHDTDCPATVQHLAQLCMSSDVTVRPTALEAQRELLAWRNGHRALHP